MKTVIAFDPGPSAIGWGVVRQAGAEMHYVASGHELFVPTKVREMLGQYAVDMVAIEDVAPWFPTADSAKAKALFATLSATAAIAGFIEGLAFAQDYRVLKMAANQPQGKVRYSWRTQLTGVAKPNDHDVRLALKRELKGIPAGVLAASRSHDCDALGLAIVALLMDRPYVSMAVT